MYLKIKEGETYFSSKFKIFVTILCVQISDCIPFVLGRSLFRRSSTLVSHDGRQTLEDNAETAHG